MYCDQSQICPIAWQCSDEPMFCGCYIHGLHGVCNSAFSLHSIERSNHEACMPHTCTPPNQKPVQIIYFKKIMWLSKKLYEVDTHAISLHIIYTCYITMFTTKF
jgi:hypothetical protein